MNHVIYYLPGRGGYLLSGLGEGLRSRGLDVVGRELRGEFIKASFGDQVSIIVEDLKYQHWNAEARVIANSYGAYLFLHAQAELPPFPGSVLLLSPIVGTSSMPAVIVNKDVHFFMLPLLMFRQRFRPSLLVG